MSQYIKKLQAGGTFSTSMGDYDINEVLRAFNQSVLDDLNKLGHVRKKKWPEYEDAYRDIVNGIQNGTLTIDAAGIVSGQIGDSEPYKFMVSSLNKAIQGLTAKEAVKTELKTEKVKYDASDSGMEAFNQHFFQGELPLGKKESLETLNEWYLKLDDEKRNLSISQYLQFWAESLDPNLDYDLYGGYEKVKNGILAAKNVFDSPESTDNDRWLALNSIGLVKLANIGRKPEVNSAENAFKVAFKKSNPFASDNEIANAYLRSIELYKLLQLKEALELEKAKKEMQKLQDDNDFNDFISKTYLKLYQKRVYNLPDAANINTNAPDVLQNAAAAFNEAVRSDNLDLGKKLPSGISMGLALKIQLKNMINELSNNLHTSDGRNYIFGFNRQTAQAWNYDSQTGQLSRIDYTNPYLNSQLRYIWEQIKKQLILTNRNGGQIKSLARGGIGTEDDDSTQIIPVSTLSPELQLAWNEGIALNPNLMSDTIDLGSIQYTNQNDTVKSHQNQTMYELANAASADKIKAFTDWPLKDQIRTISAITDGFMAAGLPITHYFHKKSSHLIPAAHKLGIATTLGNAIADYQDLPFWDATKNTAINLGMDYLSKSGVLLSKNKFINGFKHAIPIILTSANAALLINNNKEIASAFDKIYNNNSNALTSNDIILLSLLLATAAGITTGVTSSLKGKRDLMVLKEISEKHDIGKEGYNALNIMRGNPRSWMDKFPGNINYWYEKKNKATHVLTQEEKDRLNREFGLKEKETPETPTDKTSNQTSDNKTTSQKNEVSEGESKPVNEQENKTTSSEERKPENTSSLTNTESEKKPGFGQRLAKRFGEKKRGLYQFLKDTRDEILGLGEDYVDNIPSNTKNQDTTPGKIVVQPGGASEDGPMVDLKDPNYLRLIKPGTTGKGSQTNADNSKTNTGTSNNRNRKNKKRRHLNGGSLDYIRTLRNFTGDNAKSSIVLSKHENGGILKAASGMASPDVLDPEDPRNLQEGLNNEENKWYFDLWKQQYLTGWKPSLSTANWSIENDNHHKAGDLSSAFKTNKAYTDRNDLVGKDINYYYNNYYTKPTDNTLDAFITAYNAEIDALNKPWYDFDTHKYNDRNWTRHGERFKKLYNSRSLPLTDDNKAYSLSWDNNTKDILGSTMWQRRGDIYKKSFGQLNSEEKKKRVHYVKDLGWVYKKENGYIAKLDDSEIKQLGLPTNGTSSQPTEAPQSNQPTQPTESTSTTTSTATSTQTQATDTGAKVEETPEEKKLLEGMYALISSLTRPQREYDWNKLLSNLHNAYPNAIALRRLAGHIYTAKGLERFALKNQPALKGFMDQKRSVYKDLPGEMAANAQANQIASQMGQPRTSDASINMASMLEGLLKAGQLNYEAQLKSNDLMRQNIEKQLGWAKEVRDYNRPAKDFNLAALIEDANYKNKVRQATKSNIWTNVDTALQEQEYRAREENDRRKGDWRYLTERYFAQLAAQEAANSSEYQGIKAKLIDEYDKDKPNAALVAEYRKQLQAIQNRYSERLWRERYRLYGLEPPKTSYAKRGGIIDDSDIKKRQKDHDRLVKEVLHTITHHLKALDNLSKGQLLSIKKLLS